MHLYFFKHSRWAVICLSAIFLFSLIPLIPVVIEGGGFRGASTPYIDVYYTAKAHEVYDGHPLIGNPVYFEHRNGIAPAFILPFWLYTLPLIIGLPLAVTVEFNFTFWSLVFGVILYLFFRRLNLSGAWSAMGTIAVYVVMYSWLLAPISMGLVHPVFLLFILAFFIWWEGPAYVSRDIFLGFVTAFAIYEYTYMLQIIAVFLLLVFVYLLFTRDWVRVRHALIAGAITSLVCIPFLIMTYVQIHDPNYFESMIRTGLGHTRIPSSEAFRVGARFFSFIALVYSSWKWIFRARGFPHTSFVIQYVLLGLSIVIVSFSNVITGLDLETASHAARFMEIWFIVGSIAAVYFLIGALNVIRNLPISRKLILGAIVFLVLMSDLYYVTRVDLGSINIEKNRIAVRNAETFLPAMEWLDANEKEPKVVWTDPRGTLSSFIPIYTKHYLLYSSVANVELLSSEENEERYLVASALSKPTLESIASDVGSYGGGGILFDAPKTINREVKMCLALRFLGFARDCGSQTDARTLYAGHYEDMYKKFKSEIQPHLPEELKKFHVSYIMKDLQLDNDFHPERLPFVQKVYSDSRFEIYNII